MVKLYVILICTHMVLCLRLRLILFYNTYICLYACVCIYLSVFVKHFGAKPVCFQVLHKLHYLKS